MIIIGIDPGITGAIAAITDDGAFLDLYDIPVMAKGKGKSKVKNQVNAAELVRILNLFTGDSVCYLERVNSMPGQGVASMFSMGDTFGCLRTATAALDIRTEIITPREWKKYFKLGSDKEVIRAKAIEMYSVASLSRKKDHNRAEALLIANYGAGQIKG